MASGWTQGPGFDPAKPAASDRKSNTRMELPPDAYVSDTKKSSFALRGNKFNTEGKPDVIEVNQYRMAKFDFSKKIYQYDVSNDDLPKPEPRLTLARWFCRLIRRRRRVF